MGARIVGVCAWRDRSVSTHRGTAAGTNRDADATATCPNANAPNADDRSGGTVAREERRPGTSPTIDRSAQDAFDRERAAEPLCFAGERTDDGYHTGYDNGEVRDRDDREPGVSVCRDIARGRLGHPSRRRRTRADRHECTGAGRVVPATGVTPDAHHGAHCHRQRRAR